MQQYRRRHHANNSRLFIIIGALAFVVVIYVALPQIVPRFLNIENPAPATEQAVPAQGEGIEVELAPADSAQ